MAELYASYLNPIRFRPQVNQDDMPRIDKMVNRTQYYKGVYALGYDADWLLGEPINIQLQSNDIIIPGGGGLYISELQVVTPFGYFYISGVDVTPTGWVGNKIYNYTYTPTSEGLYYFVTNSAGLSDYNLISDVFLARVNNNDLIEIQYSDTENRNSGVFYDSSGTSIWSPKAYFTGTQEEGDPRNEYSIYINASAEPRKIQSDPLDTIDINFTDLTKKYKKQLNRIFSCDTISVNGQPVQNTENYKVTPMDKSDGMNASINLVEINDDGFAKNY